jgi:hypothetical protein
MSRQTLIQHRRDTTSNWSTVNPILASGEIGYVISGTDAGKFKIGDGTTAWNSLAFSSGSGGGGGLALEDVSYTHNQNTSSTTWSIAHNLGYQPSVTTQDAAGTVIEGTISHTNANNVVVSFSISTTGKAFLS